MRPVSLWRSTPFRFAVLVAMAVVLSFLVIIILAASGIRARMQGLQDQSIFEIYSLVQTQAQTGGAAGLSDAVDALLRQKGSDRVVILLRDDTNQGVAGNMNPVDVPDGWVLLPGRSVGRPDAEYMRLFSGPVGPFQLTVGAVNDQVVDAIDAIQRILGWAALAAVIVALALGARIAKRFRDRQRDFETTMSRVAEGDLSARIPISRADDDVDRLSARINTALSRLESLVEGMQQVSTDIAHDLRTPLNRLSILLHTAIAKLEEGGDPTADLNAAGEECANIDATFAALLRIAQIEAGARRSSFAPVDLRALMAELTDTYTAVADDGGMTLQCVLPDQPVIVPGDHELLTQAVVNLIENAFRHCPAGTVVTCSVMAGAHPALEVRDNGPGISADERPKVTRRLYRSDKSRHSPGAGLGLALVRAIADLHDATLTLTDANPGLKVRLEFPVDADRRG
jgi:signal transduction histidine kinase